MPTGKLTQARAKRQSPPTNPTPPPAQHDLVCPQLEAIFRGFNAAQDAVAVCRLALERVGTPECNDIANVISRIILVRMDYNLRLLDRLTRSFGGSTEYSDDNEDIDYEAYGEVAQQGRSHEPKE